MINSRDRKLSKISPSTEDKEKEKLMKELKKQEEVKKSLSIACSEVENELRIVNESIRDNDDEYAFLDSIWKDKYEHQADINAQLEGQLAALGRQLEEIKKKDANIDNSKEVNASGDDLSLLELQRMLEQLKKKKAQVEWEIHGNEWRLNREGKMLDEIEEGLKELQTRLNETTVKIIESRHHKEPQDVMLLELGGATYTSFSRRSKRRSKTIINDMIRRS